MFSGFNGETIDFMWNIRFNNEKSWFLEHKQEYKQVFETPMKELAADVEKAFSEKHPELGLRLHVSRIYRDARRTHGKGPYKDNLWFTLRQYDEFWLDKPVFWFELGPECWSYGLGYYLAAPLSMLKHRARIDRDPKPAEKLMRSLNSQSEFVLEGESYARPKGDPGKLLFDWYNMKNFSIIHEETLSEALFSQELASRLEKGFEFLLPYYSYLISIEADPDPRNK
jgi:uncharacterized protein (TIGR02453 family)